MTIFSTAAELLGTGPRTLDDLTAHVVAAGATRSRNPESTVRQALNRRAVQLSDERWADPLPLLEGRFLTTRDCAEYDLALLHQAAHWAPLPLATGGVLTPHPWSGELQGPHQWLPHGLVEIGRAHV